MIKTDLDAIFSEKEYVFQEQLFHESFAKSLLIAQNLSRTCKGSPAISTELKYIGHTTLPFPMITLGNKFCFLELDI